MPNKKPNVLIFFTDDQRHNTIHAMGCEEIKTPNLDAFSDDAVAFSHAHIMGGTSGAVCMPSRSMLQTGRDLFSLYGQGKRNGAIIPEDFVTMPEYLKANGYFTQHIGKWHQDKASFVRSYSHADRIFGFHAGPVVRGYGNMGGHYNPVLFDWDPTGEFVVEKAYNFNEQYEKIPARYGNGKVHSTDAFCDSAVDFINSYDREEPFYLYLATVAPHDPRNAPEEYHAMYDTQSVSTPENFMPVHPFDNGDMYIRDEVLENHPRSKYAIRRHIADYYAMISHVDKRFGDVIQALKDKGIYDDTVIVFAGDNGLALGQHGLLGKQSLYEHSIRVPLLFKPVGDYKPKHTDAYCYLFDIFPTICELCGLEKPQSVRGTSFAPILFGKTESIRDDMFGAYRNLQRSYKTKQYKLIEYYVDGNRTTQLFDLQKDKWEMNNLADDEEYTTILKYMQEKLLEKQKLYNDPLVIFPKDMLAQEIW